MAQISQTNAAKLHYFAEKDRLVSIVVLGLLLFCCFGFCLRLSAWSARNIVVSSVRIDWVLLRVILPQIAQITQRNAASCIISQRKTVRWGNCSFAVIWGLLFWGSSAIICGICWRHWGFVVRIDWVSLREYSPADSADHADVYSLHVYIPFHIEGLFVGFKVYYICSAFFWIEAHKCIFPHQ